jgi:hypothetical protein
LRKSLINQELTMSFTRRSCLLRGFGASVTLFSAGQPSWAQNANARKAAPTGPDLRLLAGKVTRLSILTDRLIRSQAQRALNVLAQRGERIVGESVSEMRKTLVEVSEGLSGMPNLAQKHQAVFREYADFLEQARNLEPKNRAGLLKLSVQSDDLGGEVDVLADDLVKEIGQPTAKLLTTTASLQRLSQDTAVHFLLGHTGPEARDQLEKVTAKRAQFNKFLSELRNAPVKSAQTSSLLPLLENQWMLMDKALDIQSRDTSAMENVCTTSERTLEVLTMLYPAYEALLKVG